MQGLARTSVGQLEAGRHSLLRELKKAYDTGRRIDYPRAIYGLAEIASAFGRREEAVELAALVHNHDVTPHEVKVDAAELLNALEADLPPDVYEAAYARGTSLDLDEVAQQRLEED